MTKEEAERLSDTLRYCFVSPNVADANGEPANLVDVVQHVANGVGILANAITPRNAAPGRCVNGHVASLTEAGMAIADALCRVATAIENMHGD